MKRLILLILCLILVGGCTEKKKYTLNEMRERMLAYMTDKYKEEFRMTGIGQTNLFGNRYGATVDSKKNPQYTDIGVYWDIVDGEVVITDGYSMLLTDPLVEPYVSEVLKETFLDTRYNFTAGVGMKDTIEPYDYKADIYHHLKTDINSIDIWIFVPDEDDIDIENKIKNLVNWVKKDSNATFYVGVVVSVVPIEVYEHDRPLYEAYYQSKDSKALEGEEGYNHEIRSYSYYGSGKIEKFEHKQEEESK